MDSLRQGDVGFFRIDEVPEGYEKTGTVLEIRGEREGHLHRAEGLEVFNQPATAVAERPTITESSIELPVAVVRALEERTMTHSDHPDLKILPGVWEVQQARTLQRRGD